MVEKRVATRDTSLKDTAEMFRDLGIDAFDWYEGEEGPVHMVRFHAEENEGFKAVDVAKEIGLWPIELRRVWYYRYGFEDSPDWELIFNYPPQADKFDEETISLMVKSLSYTPLYRTASAAVERSTP